MKKKFKVGQSNEVLKNNITYDLHNDYDFVGIYLYAKTNHLEIYFEPNPEFGAGKPKLCLNFRDVDYLEFSPNFGSTEIHGIEELGYKTPSDRDDEWLMSEGQSSKDDHLFIRMIGHEFIRIHAGIAEIVFPDRTILSTCVQNYLYLPKSDLTGFFNK